MITEQQAQLFASEIQGVVDECIDKDMFVRELLAVNEEIASPQPGRFHNVVYIGGTLTFTTDPITLDGVYLGRYDLEFSAGHYDLEYPSYICRITPIDPHPYAPSGYPHPHVDEDILCYGEAREAVRNAALRGDVMSIARLTNAVLHVYNGANPHMRLGAYTGPECFDCGAHITYEGEPERSDTLSGGVCACYNKVCNECGFHCELCTDWTCADCAVTSLKRDGEFIRHCKRCRTQCYKCSTLIPTHEDYRRIISNRDRPYHRFFCFACNDST